MKDLSYFQMRAHLYPKEQERSVHFKLQELETVWFCSQKNVKRKLKKFEDKGLLNYKPGVGRGHLSRLYYRCAFQKEVEEAASELVKNEQMDTLIQLMQLPIPKVWFSNVSAEIRDLFGLQSSNERRDVLRSIITRPLTTLDPLYAGITFESYLMHQLGDTLVRYDADEGKILPHLAHHWNADDGWLRWTFYLRKGVRFHHQRIMTSEDVKHTFERFTEKRASNRWLLENVQEIECPSLYKVVFKLKKPDPFFLRMTSAHNLSILPQDIPFDEYQWIGTGPFKLKERSKQKIVLEAFDQYFLERPYLDDIEFWHMPKDTVTPVSFQIADEEESQNIQRIEDVEVGFRFLTFNFRKPMSIVRNASFRKAIYHLLDVRKMYRDLDRSGLVEASSYFPWKSRPILKDRGRIESLLEASGYEEELLTVYSLDFPKAVEEAEWFVKEAELAGIRLKHKTFSIEDFYLKKIDQEADLLFMGEVATTDLQLSFLGAFYNESLIFHRFFDQKQLGRIAELLEQYKWAEDEAEREQWMDKIENYIIEENLFIFMYHPIKRHTFHPMIRDIRLESFGHIDLRKLWIP